MIQMIWYEYCILRSQDNWCSYSWGSNCAYSWGDKWGGSVI